MPNIRLTLMSILFFFLFLLSTALGAVIKLSPRDYPSSLNDSSTVYTKSYNPIQARGLDRDKALGGYWSVSGGELRHIQGTLQEEFPHVHYGTFTMIILKRRYELDVYEVAVFGDDLPPGMPTLKYFEHFGPEPYRKGPAAWGVIDASKLKNKLQIENLPGNEVSGLRRRLLNGRLREPGFIWSAEAQKVFPYSGLPRTHSVRMIGLSVPVSPECEINMGRLSDTVLKRMAGVEASTYGINHGPRVISWTKMRPPLLQPDVIEPGRRISVEACKKLDEWLFKYQLWEIGTMWQIKNTPKHMKNEDGLAGHFVIRLAPETDGMVRVGLISLAPPGVEIKFSPTKYGLPGETTDGRPFHVTNLTIKVVRLKLTEVLGITYEKAIEMERDLFQEQDAFVAGTPLPKGPGPNPAIGVIGTGRPLSKVS